jgi:hypothetical protein
VILALPLPPPKGDTPVSILNPTNGPPSFATLLGAPILNVNGVNAIEPALIGAAQQRVKHSHYTVVSQFATLDCDLLARFQSKL